MTLTEVGELLAASNGRRPTRATLARWVRTGVKVGGRVVQLAATRSGGRWITSADAVEAFVRELNRKS